MVDLSTFQSNVEASPRQRVQEIADSTTTTPIEHSASKVLAANTASSKTLVLPPPGVKEGQILVIRLTSTTGTITVGPAASIIGGSTHSGASGSVVYWSDGDYWYPLVLTTMS